MSKEIDWPKAPEGAEYWCDDQWFKTIDGEWFVWYPSAICWAKPAYKSPDNFSWWGRAVERPAQTWNGEGLPPVGTVCEWTPWSTERRVVEILAYHGDEAWMKYRDHTNETFTVANPAFFYPIRTKEQIAAEERKQAIDEICYDICFHFGAHKGSEKYLNLATTLYDAGYRKTESDK